LSNFISPSIPDVEGEGIVKSLAYAPVEGLGKSLGWMTNGSLAMTTQIENGKKILV
jgi:elongator complex protein 1